MYLVQLVIFFQLSDWIPEDLPFTEERPWSYLDTPNKVIALVI